MSSQEAGSQGLSTKPEIQIMFEQFQNTAFYRWLDRVITGRYRWLILPITGFIDGFIVVIPTEFVIVMYMMRNKEAVWWQQTLIASVFTGLSYAVLAWIVGQFGVDALSWLSAITGDDFANSVNNQISGNVTLLAMSAGITSFFPMPATAFGVTVGLLGASIPALMLGAAIGKFVRFGIFAYGTQRWGNEALDYYLKHSFTISLALVALIVLYLFVK